MTMNSIQCVVTMIGIDTASIKYLYLYTIQQHMIVCRMATFKGQAIKK